MEDADRQKGADGPVTQRDIAERAGVTVMAVSRALRGMPGVSATTAQRIRKIADELGYQPNPLVSSLMRCRRSRRRPDLGLVIGWYGPTRAVSLRERDRGMYDLFEHLLEGARETCSTRGFRLETFNDPDLKGEALKHILVSRGIRGLILGPRGKMTADIGLAPPYPFHVVQIGRSRHDPNHDRVVTDSFSAMRRCVRALRKQGCARIGYIDTVDHQTRSEDTWLAAFLLERGPKGCPPGLKDQQSEPMEAFLRAYLQAHRPDGLVVGSPRMAGSWRKLGVSLPYVCLVREGQPATVTGTQSNERKIGAEAARWIIEKILGPQDQALPPRTIVLGWDWHEGTSHLRTPN
ncbi:MAG: LacI family DNA-binding transcriptional regulator [Oceanipulchritudo sp.]